MAFTLQPISTHSQALNPRIYMNKDLPPLLAQTLPSSLQWKLHCTPSLRICRCLSPRRASGSCCRKRRTPQGGMGSVLWGTHATWSIYQG
jgi:hypothetical protein